jgi:hypothetical protein
VRGLGGEGGDDRPVEDREAGARGRAVNHRGLPDQRSARPVHRGREQQERRDVAEALALVVGRREHRVGHRGPVEEVEHELRAAAQGVDLLGPVSGQRQQVVVGQVLPVAAGHGVPRRVHPSMLPRGTGCGPSDGFRAEQPREFR